MKHVIAERPKYLAELFKRYAKAQNLRSADVAKMLYIAPETYRSNVNKETTQWRIGDLERYCAALNIPIVEALDAIRKEVSHG